MAKALRADLDELSTKMFIEIKNDLNVKHDAEVVRILIKKMHKILESSKTSEKEVLTIDDQVVLEIIAEDHWKQFQRFEEEEVTRSIKTEFKLDPAKPLNNAWLTKAIEFCCSLKRN